MKPVFLAHYGPAGDVSYVQLPQAEPCSTCFLPNSCASGIDLAVFSNPTHSIVRLQTFATYVLLSNWDNQHGPVSVLSSGELIEVPISTTAHWKSFVLLDGSQFIASSGRWVIEFDLDDSIQNSMNAPLFPGTAELTSVSAPDMMVEAQTVAEEAQNSDSGFTDGEETIGDLSECKSKQPQTPDPSKYASTPSCISPASIASTTTPEACSDNGAGQCSDPPRECDFGISGQPSAKTGTMMDSLHQNSASTIHRAGDECQSISEEEIACASRRMADQGKPLLHEHSVRTAYNRLPGQESQELMDQSFNTVQKAAEELEEVPRREITTPVLQSADMQAQTSPYKDDLNTPCHESGNSPQISTPHEAIVELNCTAGEKSALPEMSKEIEHPDIAEFSSETIIVNPDRSGMRDSPAFQSITLTATRSDLTTSTPSLSRPGTRQPCYPVSRSSSADTEDNIKSVSEVRRTRSSGTSRSNSTRTYPDDTKDQTIPQRRRTKRTLQMSDTRDVSRNHPGTAGNDFPTCNPAKRRRRSSRVRILHSPELPPKISIVFSTSCKIQHKKKAMNTFTRLGGTVVDNIEAATMLCVPNTLKKTPKLILAIVTGKTIVTEDWIVDCQSEETFPESTLYLPKDRHHEREWNFVLADAIKQSRMVDGLMQSMLRDFVIYITPQLSRRLGKSMMDDFVRIAQEMGAKEVRKRLPSTKAQIDKAIVLGDDGDAEAMAVGKLGHSLYSRDLLTMAALRARLDFDEFELEIPIKEEEAS